MNRSPLFERILANSVFPLPTLLLLFVTLFASSPAFTTGWQNGLEGIEIEKERVSGNLHGAFELERAEISGGILTLRQGEDFFADREVKIFLFLEEGESMEGKKYVVKPGGGMQQSPHVHMSYKVADQGLPETEMFMSDYTMKLQFTKVKNGKVTGRIYLALPDDEKSWLSGYFKVVLEDDSEQATTTMVTDSGSGYEADADSGADSEQESLGMAMGEVLKSSDAGDATMMMPTMEESASGALPLVAMVLMGLGALFGLIGGLWLVIKGFQEHWAWGLACLTPIALVFLVLHFKKSLKPIMVSFLGILFTAGGWASAFLQLSS